MELLAALIGALTATIITLIWTHLSEKAKRRGDVLLEVVRYSDEVYRSLKDLHAHKNAIYTDNKPYLSKAEYAAASRNLTALLTTSNEVGAKLALVYGEGNAMAAFNALKSRFLEASRILWKATRSAWAIENRETLSLFEKEIDPLRAQFEATLIRGAHATTVLTENLKRWDQAIYSFLLKYIQKSKK